jgi:hypothetical protein
MDRAKLIALAAISTSVIVSSASWAMPSGQLGGTSVIQNTRTVCDSGGRCWNKHRNALAVMGVDRREYIGRWHSDDEWHHGEHHHDWDRHHRRIWEHNGDRED